MVTAEYLEYEKYRKLELSPIDKLWEFLANSVILKIKIDEKTKKQLEYYLSETHLKVKSIENIISSASTFLLFSFAIGLLVFVATAEIIYLLLVILIGASIAAFIILYPQIKFEDVIRKKEAQLLFLVLYMAMYMKNNPNIEKAFEFAMKHISPPLKLDLLKIYWYVITGKYSNILKALDEYVSKWSSKAQYFVNAMIILETVLYEPSEERRKILLDRAIEEVLEGLYDRMSEYARSLKNPIDALYMLGIVLPTLSLTLLPLLSSFLTEAFPPIMLFLFYDVIIPIGVFSIGYNILKIRPASTNYEDEYLYLYLKKKGSKIKLTTLIFFSFVFFVLLSIISNFILKLNVSYTLKPLIVSIFLIFVLGISIALSHLFYFLQVKDMVERLDSLLKELPAALIQLANRLNEGVPPEYAFYEVYKNNKNKAIGKFFGKVFYNIKFLGMSIEKAIFDNNDGALLYYPSSLLKGIMEIFVENIKRGNEVAAKTLVVIVQYLLRLNRINERIKDLLAETVSSMKLLIKLVAPLILGVIIGMDAMMIAILLILGKTIETITTVGTTTEYSGIIPTDILQLFTVKKAIPPAVLQFSVGLYLIILVWILSYVLNGIENGLDKLKEKRVIGINLGLAILVYSFTAVTAAYILWGLSTEILHIMG